jgi:uncharacterized protein YjiS (DUF1127 family)
MSILAFTTHTAARRPWQTGTHFRAAARIVRAVLTWPLRVHANRMLLNQMAGMSAHELADIGLTPADLRDSAALPLDTEVGQFLSTRAASRRRAWNDRWL